MKITLIVSFLSLVISNTYAYNFKHFRLKGELRTLKNSEKSLVTPQEKRQMLKQVNQKLLGTSSTNDSYSDIFSRILEAIGTDYENIGNRESGPLIVDHQVGGGIVNFSGFSWQKPFANFKLFANRELAPDLYDENRWIVHDTLTIVISASTLLTNMRDADMIDIDDEGLAAFAGIGFSRTYHYYHFASGWVDGIKADYSKLFVAFTRFTPSSVLNLDQYDIMKRQDTFMFNAGGFVNVPIWNGLGIKGGVIVSKSFENTITLQATGPQDSPKENEFLRYSLESESQTSANAHLSLQLDFFNLLKISLLSYDLEYSVEKSEKVYLSFFENNKEELLGSKKSEFARLLNAKASSVNSFKDNIVQQDKRYKQNVNSKFYFLIFGALTKSATEQIKIVKDGVEKVFFKHYAESRKVIQNFWSKILGFIVHKIFQIPASSSNDSETAHKMEIEYEYEGKQEKQIVNSEEKFSVKLSHTFYARKTKGFLKKYYRKKAVTHISRHTNLDMNIAKMVGDSKLRGPIQVVTNIILEKQALTYFNKQSPERMLKVFKLVCKGSNNNCYRDLTVPFAQYFLKYRDTGLIDLIKFKKLVGTFYKKARSLYDFYLLFGEDSVFINGSIDATTDKGMPFQNFFKAGQFKGLGVIDAFMRKGQTSVVLPIETK